MNIYKKTAFTGLLWSLGVFAFAQRSTQFSAAEQQQISIGTPGLFAKGNAFTVDFDQLKDEDYAFPLPVGKATLTKGQALDIVSTKGDAVKAMFDGTVRLSRKTPQYGNIIVVRHDNGLETAYGGNAQNLVKVGDRVKAGQTLAIVGGKADRYSCLFAILVNGGWINPSIIVDPGSHRLRGGKVRFKKTGKHVDIATIKDVQPEEAAETTRLLAGKGVGRSLDPDEVTTDPFANGGSFRLNLDQIHESRWAYPLPGSHVISPYGGRRNHSGVDVKTYPNDKILAAFDGVVTKASPFSGYGNCIVIRHAYGFETLYSHQSKNLVKVGQKVKAGQVIGLTGRTGRATTEHLHFEVKFKGRRLNPNVIFNHVAKCLRNVTLILTKSGGVTSKSN